MTTTPASEAARATAAGLREATQQVEASGLVYQVMQAVAAGWDRYAMELEARS